MVEQSQVLNVTVMATEFEFFSNLRELRRKKIVSTMEVIGLVVSVILLECSIAVFLGLPKSRSEVNDKIVT